eukprot:scaffold25932_cov107-Isochrysis_galbana.AAC.2
MCNSRASRVARLSRPPAAGRQQGARWAAVTLTPALALRGLAAGPASSAFPACRLVATGAGARRACTSACAAARRFG